MTLVTSLSKRIATKVHVTIIAIFKFQHNYAYNFNHERYVFSCNIYIIGNTGWLAVML